MAAATAVASCCVLLESSRRVTGIDRIASQVSPSSLAFGRVGVVWSRPLECLSATKQKRSPISHIDADDVDDEVTEFETMEDWMKSKPSGFGLKEYDTSVEEKLLAEIEADRIAQAAAALARKAGKKPVKAKQKAAPPPEGVQVCVRSLPKKRNIERDLRASFNKNSVEGLLHIRPIVQGNEKTREPVCKGTAFLTFATDDDAENFVERFNGEMVKFGKVEKKLVCELAIGDGSLEKQVPASQGTRLPVRERLPETLVPSSSSSTSAVEHIDAEDLSDGQVVLDLDSMKEQDDDLDSLEVPDDELLRLEEEIWAELEDEDDFELDRELEDDKDGLDGGLTLAEIRGSDDGPYDETDDTDQTGEELVEVGMQAAHCLQSSNDLELKEDKDEVDEDDEDNKIEHQKAGPGQGFAGANTKKSDATSEEKDRKIQKLESKLQELQLLLKKRNSAEFTKETEAREAREARGQDSEKRIEALEKRLLGKVKAALVKDPKLQNGNKSSTTKKAVSSKNNRLSKSNPLKTNAPNLGSAGRLKKKERKIYTEVLSKYSSAT